MGMGAPKPGSTLPPQPQVPPTLASAKGQPQVPPAQPSVPPTLASAKGQPQVPPAQPSVPPTLASAKGQPQVPPVQPQVPPTLASAKGQPQVPPAQPIPSAGGKSGIAGPIQQIVDIVGQVPQQPGQVPVQGGRGPLPPFALPSHYQSPYANYGFDPGLQSYLDQQMYRSYTDGGVGFQYDPTNQTFTGGTRSGSYNPIPLSVMQQAAGGNRDVLNPYFQSRFPQPTGPVPAVKPQGPQQPFTPRPFPGQGNDIRRGPTSPQMPQPQGPQQRGLGALQTDKFRNKLG
jgi:hypothetical protein